ncbi:hybrid sensor histidine kinase/response regulator [Gemmatimonas phototrophica]|uniref:hybrid sensor histidine kinase/response regulator n=1 Tax=Gemmatimonas phototrophica TaxID=1379270 RepID=UPI00047D962A|nr:hybrid sensor histidine kinase/response regulator [Gemmatimonas phototrophica]
MRLLLQLLSRCARRFAGAALPMSMLVPAANLAQAQPVAEAMARAPEYVREVIDPDLGLPDTYIATVAQTPDGYLWLGTRRGLVRFDGLNTTLFDPRNTPALPASTINALSVDRTGALWISTDRGLAVREGSTFRRIAADQIPAGTTWEVVRDRRGRVWVSGSFGVRVGDGTRFTAVPGFNEHIYSLIEDQRGRIWMGGRKVLASYVEGETEPVRWAPSNQLRVYDMALAPDGSLWVGVREGAQQLDISDPARITLKTTVSTANAGALAQVWSMTIGPNGALWLGTDTRGVLRWDGEQLRPVDAGERKTIDPVWWLTRDLRGNVWAGTAGGLARYRSSAFRTVTAGLSATSTWSVRGDVNGTPWASTEDGQVSWFDGARWRPVFSGTINLAAPVLWPTPDGAMLASDSEGRLLRLTKSGVTDISARVGFPEGTLLSVFQDRDGAIIGTTSVGLLRSSEGRVDSLYRRAGLAARDEARVIMRDTSGRLLIGGRGLTIIDDVAVQRIGHREGLSDTAVLALHSTPHALWIATADSGLFVMRGSRVVSLSRANVRLGRGINGIMDDASGYLWLTTRSGLMRAAVAELLRASEDTTRSVAVRQFDRSDGLPTTDFNSDYQNQLFRDNSGRIWLPTYAGPVLLTPTAVVADTVPPQAHIESVQVDGVLQPLGAAIRLSGHPDRVEVTFSATNALVPRRVRAEFRILGVDSSWVDAGRRRTLSFGPLAGGRYRVEIRVAGEDGEWHPRVASIDIEVPRTLTEHGWFFPALTAVAGLLVFLFTRIRLATARARERELSNLVAERTADLEASRAGLEVRVAERTEALSRELAERYKLEQRLESSRRMASLGRLAGGVSHEINNALATVLGFAQLAQMASRNDERVHADLGEVVRAGRRAANITHQLLAFARQHHSALLPTSLETVVHDNLRSLQQLCAPIAVDVTAQPSLPLVNADVGQIEQLLVNLVKNARDAGTRDGHIRVSLTRHTLDTANAVGDRVLPAGEYVVLSVRDTGTGISSATLEQLFEPFFTTKEVNEGSGLGLAVVQGIVGRHNGAIAVSSVEGEGTTFSAWFPEHRGDMPPAITEAELQGGGETILLAEDDASIRRFATRMLTDHGYRVLDAEDGAAAIALVGKSIEAIDLVLTDVLMPNANGLELARLLRAARPDLPLVFMTGYAGLDDQALAELRATGPVLAKPFTQETLLQVVQRALEGRRSRAGIS